MLGSASSPETGQAGGSGTAARVRVWWVFVSRHGVQPLRGRKKPSTLLRRETGLAYWGNVGWGMGWLGLRFVAVVPIQKVTMMMDEGMRRIRRAVERARVWPHV